MPNNQDIIAEKEAVINNFRNEISEEYQKYIAKKYQTKFAKDFNKDENETNLSSTNKNNN